MTIDPDLSDQGQVHLELHHETIGEGQLRRPLGLVEEWTLESGERQLEDTMRVTTDGGA